MNTNQNRFFTLLIVALVVTAAWVFLSMREKNTESKDQASPQNAAENNPDEGTNPAAAASASVATSAAGSASSAASGSSTASQVQNSAPTKVSADLTRLQSLLSRLDPNGTWTILKDINGRVNSITGGSIAAVGTSYETGLGFAKEIASSLEIPQDQVVAEGIQLKETSYSKSYHYQQSLNGYLVENGYIELFLNSSTSNIYDITSELRELGPVDTRISYPRDLATEMVKEKYSDKNVTLLSEPSVPVIFNEKPKVSYLVWKIQIKTRIPLLDTRNVYVSAVTGKIIYDQSLRRF